MALTRVDRPSSRAERPPENADRRAVAEGLRELVAGVVVRRNPSGASAFVDGPAGIGKSFLIGQLLDEVPGAGSAVTVLRAAADHRRRNSPFATIEQLTGLPPEGSDQSDHAFDRIDVLCGTGPVVVWVDDAQHCDAASLTVLRRLVWASRDLPLAVLITARPFPVREQLEILTRQTDLQARLPPMDRMMVERLVFDRTGRWPGPRLRKTLATTAGNPLFVTELLRALDEADSLIPGGGDTVEVRLDAVTRPAGLESTIREHLSQLDESTRGLLAALAVWGTAVSVDDLASTLYTSADGLLTPLWRAAESGLVEERGGTVDFSHDLYREVLYADLPDPDRRATHRRVAQVFRADGSAGPALIAEHALRGAAPDGPSDPQVVAALRDAVLQTRQSSPEVAADLLGDAEAIADVATEESEKHLVQRTLDLFLAGRGPAAERVIGRRIAGVTDRAVAGGLQSVLIRSLVNRADVPGSLAAIDRTTAIPGLPPVVRRQLDALRRWVSLLDGELPADGQHLLDRYIAAADNDAQAGILVTLACAAYLSGDPERGLELLSRRSALVTDVQDLHARTTAIVWPAMFELTLRGPASALVGVQRARRLSAERGAHWVDPFLGFVAGGAALTAGDWDDAVAELDTALEQAEETGTGWISIAVGNRAYIDAHRGDGQAARARLDDFRSRGLPLQFGRDEPGQADLAALEAEGSIRAASTLARALWAAARIGPAEWCLELAPDVARVALVGMERRLSEQVAADLAALPVTAASAAVVELCHGMVVSDTDEIRAATDLFVAQGRGLLAAYGFEELALAAASRKDKVGAAAALEAAIAGYDRMRAVPDRDRVLARARALGLRRGPREGHRTVDSGWDSLTATERRIAALVRDGLTNREIGTRLFISPRTVQTHVSHVLAKTGLRSRVEVAAAAGADLG